MKVAALFPGQGSQVVGMGKDFYENNETAREIFSQADTALGYSLSSLCFDGPLEELTLTKNAQPAILTCSYISYTLLGFTPIAAAGHSLGEYTALVAANTLSFEDAVQLVHKRGSYMQEAVQPGAGKMLAVMGASADVILTATQKISEGVVEIANLNCPGQIIVAGSKQGIETFEALMLEQGVKVKPLNVSAPFHCVLMQPAAEKLAEDLDATSFADPQFPVYANVAARAISNAADARELLKQQVCGSVRWEELIRSMIDEQSVSDVLELGPGKVLSGLMRRIDKSIKTHNASSINEIEELKSLLGN